MRTLVLSLNYYFCLTAFLLFLHSLTSLISNRLGLLFGALGKPRETKAFFFLFFFFFPLLQTENGGGCSEGLLYPGRACRLMLGFSPYFSLIRLITERNRGKKRNKVLVREVPHKICRELSFSRTLFQMQVLLSRIHVFKIDPPFS